MKAAVSARGEAFRLNPKLTMKWSIAHYPNIPGLFEGLRKVGMPQSHPEHDRKTGDLIF
jgi:hypothetical protein